MGSYFSIQPFERIQDKSIYSYLGIRFFQKYLLFTDLIRFRFGRKRQIAIGKCGRAAELHRLNWETRRNEVIHLLCMLVIGVVVALHHDNLSPLQWCTILLINLLVNVYPIFLQRHNRMRILKILARMLAKMPSSDRSGETSRQQ